MLTASKEWCREVEIISLYITVRIFPLWEAGGRLKPLTSIPPMFCSWQGILEKEIFQSRFAVGLSMGEVKVEVIFQKNKELVKCTWYRTIIGSQAAQCGGKNIRSIGR